METFDPGHTYWLDQLDGDGRALLIFVKREGEGYPGNVGHYQGTTMQEVIRALIARAKYVHAQIPDGRNPMIVKHLRGALLWLEDRAAERHGRTLDPNIWNVDREIEDIPTCSGCLHVGCEGGCGRKSKGDRT
jgi:hypothetical protein